MDFKQIFEYNHTVRRSFLDALAKLPWDEVVKNREASFYSMRNIFLHMLDAEERLILYLIPGRISEWKAADAETFNDIETIQRRMRMIEEKTEQYLNDIKPEDLTQIVGFPLRSGGVVPMSVEDVLTQAMTEELHHRGELIALLWQMNIEPPSMEWHWYVRLANEGKTKHKSPTKIR